MYQVISIDTNKQTQFLSSPFTLINAKKLAALFARFNSGILIARTVRIISIPSIRS